MYTEITDTNVGCFGRLGDRWPATLSLAVSRRLLGWAIAGVWLHHGLYNKLLHGEPRHLLIVQSIPGLAGDAGETALMLVGLGEVFIAAWVLLGRWPLLNAGVQTAALLTMNIMELTWAQRHLLSPAGLLPINLIFLTLVWVWAWHEATDGTGLHRLKRHPFPIEAHFKDCLVLTYALPEKVLKPLLPPGLELDAVNGKGFLAVALVQTQDLRPAGWPRAAGNDFFLAGYRVFTKFRHNGRTIRGLRILRSDADKVRMVIGGNLLTHYNYHRCAAQVDRNANALNITVTTPGHEADLSVSADLNDPNATLPPGSPFTTLREARRFAGPLPWTFDYEPQTHSIIAIKGVRNNWNPRPVSVRVHQNTFLNSSLFRDSPPVLASAFHVSDIDYRWERGRRFPLSTEDKT